MYVESREFESAEGFLDALTPWSGQITGDGYIFRGHSDKEYLLLPTSVRKESLEKMWGCSNAGAKVTGSPKDNDFSNAYIEYQLIRDFYRGADVNGLQVPVSDRLRERLHQKIDRHAMSEWLKKDKWLPDDMQEVAALAQHYGIPTRLLDWTYDPFVAAFFASKPSDRAPRDICIWGLNSTSIGTFNLVDKDFPLKLVTPHYSGNPNLAAQKGLFTHWSQFVPGLDDMSEGEIKALPAVDRRPLNDLLREWAAQHFGGSLPNIFVKWVLPAKEVAKLASFLRDFGYGPGKIFPGYEGVAMEIRERQLLKIR